MILDDLAFDHSDLTTITKSEIAVFAPTPRASVSAAINVKPGRLAIIRMP
jgi:hypothetical protein